MLRTHAPAAALRAAKHAERREQTELRLQQLTRKMATGDDDGGDDSGPARRRAATTAATARRRGDREGAGQGSAAAGVRRGAGRGVWRVQAGEHTGLLSCAFADPSTLPATTWAFDDGQLLGQADLVIAPT